LGGKEEGRLSMSNSHCEQKSPVFHFGADIQEAKWRTWTPPETGNTRVLEASHLQTKALDQ
jgi:hypothetical protein